MIWVKKGEDETTKRPGRYFMGIYQLVHSGFANVRLGKILSNIGATPPMYVYYIYIHTHTIYATYAIYAIYAI